MVAVMGWIWYNSKKGGVDVEKRIDNYQLQMQQAKKHFLSYDQQEIIDRCRLTYDSDYFYVCFLSSPYRICRKSGDMQRQERGNWVDGNSFAEVMTILDWLCDSKKDRFPANRWINIVSQGHYFHRNLQENEEDPDANLFDAHRSAFAAACESLGGEKQAGADIGYAIELVDGLKIFVRLWHADDEFPAKLSCLWDENVLRYIRYETTWYAQGLLIRLLREKVQEQL